MIITRRKALLASAAVPVARKAHAWSHGTGFYTGSVATRSIVPAAANTAFKQSMSRTRHRMMVGVTSLQVVFPAFYVATTSGVETAWGANSTITASIEYPTGTFTQILFSGSASGTVTNGSFLLSDGVSVTIPAQAYFYVRWFCQNSAAIGFANVDAGVAYDATNGEATTYAASGLTDQTLGGTVTASNSAITTPLIILGTTSSPSCFCMGDSRCVGIYDAYVSAGAQQTLIGEVTRWIGQYFAFTNFGSAGTSLVSWLASNSNQLALSKYFSHIICQFGTNDFGSGNITAAQMIANILIARSLFGAKPFFQTTCVIGSVSTDNWATLGNQTPDGDNAQVQLFNAALRAGTVVGMTGGITGYFDTDVAVESSAASGIWVVNGTTFYATVDGAHETQAANLLIAASVAPSEPGAIFLP